MSRTEIRAALLRVANDLEAIDKALIGNTEEDDVLRDILSDIYADDFDDARAKLRGEYDPTPWCTGCGSMRKNDCNCEGGSK